MAFWLPQFLLLVLLGFITFRLVIYPIFLSPLRKIPDAKVSLYHQLVGWIYTEPNPVELLSSYEDEQRCPGLLCYPGGAYRQRVVVVDPEALKELTTTEYYGKFRKPDRLTELLSWTSGYGLLAADGPAHKTLKRKIASAFSVPRMKSLGPLFWAKGCELSEVIWNKMLKEAESRDLQTTSVTVNIALDISHATLDVIGVAAWGLDFNALADPSSEFMQAFYGMFPRNHFDVFLVALGFYFPMHTIAKLPFRRYTDFDNFKLSLKKRCSQAIALKKDLKDLSDQPDILSIIMNQDIFSDDELIEHLYTLLMAGHDATGATITWVLYELARHQEVQSRLRAEIRANVRFSDSEEMSNDVLEKLPYFQAVIHEAERMHPTAPKAPREAAVDTHLGGYAIPRGTQLLIAPLVCNRLRQTWGPDAGLFNPERWMEAGQFNGNGGSKSNYGFMTFNTGPRHCIGQSFAQGEMRAIIANIVGRFSFESNMGDPDIYFGMTMRPKGGLSLKMKLVEN